MDNDVVKKTECNELVTKLRAVDTNKLVTKTQYGLVFDTFKLTRNTIKSKTIFNGHGIAFHGTGICSYGNDFARNVIILGVY